MKKLFLLFLTLACVLVVAAQPKQKTRNMAATDKASVQARKISVTYTDGLKSFYSGRPNEAMKIFQGIILDNPNHDASYFMMSKIYAEKKNYHDAVDALLQASKIDKKNIWYKVELANVYMKMEEYASAAKLWEQICKEKDNNEYYLYALSECYLNVQKLEKVIATYDRMEEIMGHNDEITNAKVQLWLYMNKVKEAVGEYDKLIKLFPHNAEYYVKAGKIYQSNDMMPQALSYFEKASELQTNDPEVSVALANYWKQKGNKDKYFQSLKAIFANPSVEITKKTAPMHQFVSEALNPLKIEEVREAQQLAQALMQAHPDQPVGYAYMASLNVVQSRYEESIPYFETAIEKDNTVFAVWEDYCYVLKRLDQWQRLLRYESDIKELFPNNAQMLCGLGLAYLKAKNPTKALEYLKKANAYAFEAELKTTIRKAIQEAEKMGD